MFLKSVKINTDQFPTRQVFPFNIESIAAAGKIPLNADVVFFVGENGSGKSTLLDALARRLKLLPWGGSKTHKAHKNPYETSLANYLDLELSARPEYGFHFRAEAFFNYASSLDDILLDDPERARYFGGGSLNTLSHGESFLRLFSSYTCSLDGVYIFDEPEAALSPKNQLQFCIMLADNARKQKGRQFIISTHSPILLACPSALILDFDQGPVRSVSYKDTEHYRFYRSFLEAPEIYIDGYT
jgi:predicted ATPase